MRYNHRVVVVETEDEVLVVFGHFEEFERADTLPKVGADDQGAVRLTLADCLVDFCDKGVPLLVLLGGWLVHKLVCNPVGAVTDERVLQLSPKVNQALLCFLVGEKRVVSAFVGGIEIMCADDVEVNDCADVVFAGKVERVFQQRPRLVEFVALLVPKLLLVDGNPHVVETEAVQPCKVVFLNVLAAFFATFLALRKPVAEVCAAFDFEAFRPLLLRLLAAARCKCQCEHSCGNNCCY